MSPLIRHLGIPAFKLSVVRAVYSVRIGIVDIVTARVTFRKHGTLDRDDT